MGAKVVVHGEVDRPKHHRAAEAARLVIRRVPAATAPMKEPFWYSLAISTPPVRSAVALLPILKRADRDTFDQLAPTVLPLLYELEVVLGTKSGWAEGFGELAHGGREGAGSRSLASSVALQSWVEGVGALHDLQRDRRHADGPRARRRKCMVMACSARDRRSSTSGRRDRSTVSSRMDRRKNW